MLNKNYPRKIREKQGWKQKPIMTSSSTFNSFSLFAVTASVIFICGCGGFMSDPLGKR